MPREIEVKVRAKNLNEVEGKLREAGCKLSTPIHQHDVIYSYGTGTSAWEEAKEGDITLRIRREDGEAMFNLKEQRSSESDNIEYETRVDDPEAMHKILLTLRWTPQVEVKKVRRKGKLGEYEICLDEVEKLGDYVELEKLTADNANPDEVREELFKALGELGFSRTDEEVLGYDTQIYKLERKHK